MHQIKFLLFLFGVLLLTSGCSKADKAERVVYIVRVQEQQEIVSTGSIRRVFSSDGKLVEQHFPYPEGDKGIVYFRPTDGTVSKTIETYGKTGHTRSEAVWSEDGKQILHGKIFRPDGTLRMEVQRKDDVVTTNLYAKDGKWLVKTTVASDAKPEKEDTFYGADGIVLARVLYEATERKTRRGVRLSVSETATEFFVGGVRRWRLDKMKEGFTVTYYQANGSTIDYRQTWKSNFDPKLEAVEEYRSGSVTRKLMFAEDKFLVKLTECHTYPSSDKTRASIFRTEEHGVKPLDIEIVVSGSDKHNRVLHVGTLKRIEETGKSPVEFTAADAVKEVVEPFLTKRLDQKDLVDARSQISEDLSYLGTRNDEIPCKWYMR